MNAPQWRLQILAAAKAQLRQLGFRGSHTRFRKIVGDRRIMAQLFGGSDPHDTQKLAMEVYLGLDFLEFVTPKDTHGAYLALWNGRLEWTNGLGQRETVWRAYSDSEAIDVQEGIVRALPPALEKIEQRFQTWHDVLPYLEPKLGDKLDPPGQVTTWRLPKIS